MGRAESTPIGVIYISLPSGLVPSSVTFRGVSHCVFQMCFPWCLHCVFPWCLPFTVLPSVVLAFYRVTFRGACLAGYSLCEVLHIENVAAERAGALPI